MKRKSGILMHLSSLPSDYGIGDLGPVAYAFVDFLEHAKQKVWQILPVNPTSGISGNSPYSSYSSYGFNPLYISPEGMVEDGLLTSDEVKGGVDFPPGHVDFEQVSLYKAGLFDLAYSRLKDIPKMHKPFVNFQKKNRAWLHDFSLYVVLKDQFNGGSWITWPEPFRHREKKALKIFKDEHPVEIERIEFQQFLFDWQWQKLKAYANKKKIKMMGDMPIYVNYDSVDVWQNPQVFKLSKDYQQEVVAGVPPDYFSETGQRWGNPVYDWDYLKKDKFKWWVERMDHNLKIFNMTRVDHFRAFVNFWEIPVAESTAVNGYWMDVPTKDFFKTLKKELKKLPIIAEDLGSIDEDVRQKIDALGFPGMKILLFAFGGNLSDHPYLPHNYTENFVVYTGTHDNNTTQGWYGNEATDKERRNLYRYLRRHILKGDKSQVDWPKEEKKIHWHLIHLALASKACLALIPIQDVLGLGQKDRMNLPGTLENNWRWRLQKGELNITIAEQLARLTVATDRAAA